MVCALYLQRWLPVSVLCCDRLGGRPADRNSLLRLHPRRPGERRGVVPTVTQPTTEQDPCSPSPRSTPGQRAHWTASAEVRLQQTTAALPHPAQHPAGSALPERAHLGEPRRAEGAGVGGELRALIAVMDQALGSLGCGLGQRGIGLHPLPPLVPALRV